MLKPITRSNAVGWQFIENQFAVRSTNVLSSSKPKPGKRIKLRTRILNDKLKKVAKIKSYRQYVKIKTKILREVSEDEFVEEESLQNSNVNGMQSSPELISVPGPSNKKSSRTCKESSKTGQKKSRKPVHEATNNAGEKNRSRAKKDLNTIFINFDRANLEENKLETVKDIDEVVDNNNGVSCQLTSESRIPIGNVPLGDSGIDDNSQGNSSTSNQENNDGAELINSTETADWHTEGLDDLSNVFIQADNMTVTKAANEESFSKENGANKFSQSDIDNDTIHESSNEEERVEELSQTDMNNDEIEESMLREEIMEKSSQSDKNNDEIEESPPKEERTTKSLQTDMNDDKFENILAMERAEKSSQFHDDDVEKSLTKKERAEKHWLSDLDGDEIEESLAKEERIEKLSQSDENKDDIEKVLAKEESAFNDMNDNRINESWTKEESMETFSHSDTNDDSCKKKIQPTITCEEIVTSRYTIIRDESEKEKAIQNHSSEIEIVETNNELTEFDEISFEAERVSKLKRINLLCSGSESDSSEEDEKLEQAIAQPIIKPPLSSQIISDPSDSEDSDSLSLQISDSEDEKAISTARCKQRDIEPSRSRGFANKSIKDQIKEQTIVDSSVRVDEKTERNREEEEKVDNAEEEENASPGNHQSKVIGKRNDNRSKRKKQMEQVLYERRSLQYILNNLSKSNWTDENLVEECLQNKEENLLRPIELHDFVAREELIPISTSPTITLEDISMIGEEQSADEEIWFMEIPKSIVTDADLCGQSIVIEKDQITIGGTNYNVTRKHNKAVSCILQKNKKKTRYKAVNLRPVYSINVRHERMENEEFIPFNASPPPQSVPFPKNIKPRNPLIVENKARPLSSENINSVADNEKKIRQNAKKRKNSLWNMDNFILKPKRTKIDRSSVNGMKNGDLFNL